MLLGVGEKKGVPSDDQVYVYEVRIVGHNPEARRPVRSGVEHHQRESVHLPLVLAHHSVDPVGVGHSLPNSRVHITEGAPRLLPPFHVQQIKSVAVAILHRYPHPPTRPG